MNKPSPNLAAVVLIKAKAYEAQQCESPREHPDREMWEEIASNRLSELRSIYRRIFKRPMTCKGCGRNI